MTGQSPWWMALATAGVAMLGVLVGLLVNGRREERRWRREQEREDIRWRREKEKNAAERAQKDMLDWRNRKIEVYSDLLGAFKECEYAATETQHYEKVIEDEQLHYSASEFQARLAAATERFRSTAQKVILIASSALRAHIFIPPTSNSVVYRISDSGPLVSAAELKRFATTIAENRERAIATMREELGSKDDTVWSAMFRS